FNDWEEKSQYSHVLLLKVLRCEPDDGRNYLRMDTSAYSQLLEMFFNLTLDFIPTRQDELSCPVKPGPANLSAIRGGNKSNKSNIINI
ncbi:hypothetical protein L9F63_005561, partial [Diploptera punctata]